MYRENLYSFDDLQSAINPVTPGQSPYFQLVHDPMIGRLLGSLPVFIYLADIKSQRLLYASPNLDKLCGFDSAELAGSEGKKITDLFIKEDAQKAIIADNLFMEMIAAYPAEQRKQLKSVITCRLARTDGSIIPVQQQKTVLEVDSDGNPLVMMSVLIDITCGRRAFDFCSTVMLLDAVNGWTEIVSGNIESRAALSAREKEILQLLSTGKSSKILASELGISVNTVNNHRKNMLYKTRTCNIAELVNYAISQGII